MTRVLAYCLEYTEGITFRKGLAEPDEPAIVVRDLTGALRVWIEVGAPDADRLHKASKASPRVVVYTYKDPATAAAAVGGRAHSPRRRDRAVRVRPPLIDALVARLDRRTAFDLAVSDHHLYVTIGGETLDGAVTLVAAEHRGRAKLAAAGPSVSPPVETSDR